MAKYDPRFWEIPVDPKTLDSLPSRSDDPADVLIRKHDAGNIEQRVRLRNEALSQIRLLIESRLTRSQREVMELYFFQDKSQQDIAQILGISQQVVSRHLFGVLRNGRKIGGAVSRLKKICIEMGIEPEKWV